MQVADFYDALAGDYDALFDDWNESVRRQAAVIAPLLGDASAHILDVACGIGTQAIGLALRGFTVVARDVSAQSVARARREAKRLGAKLELTVGNMCEVRPDDASRFAAVIAFDNALPHLEHGELRRAFQAANAALREGGQFIGSLRDYNTLREQRPTHDSMRVFGSTPNRRVVTQVWQWSADGEYYELDHIILRELESGWELRSRRCRYRAVLRAEIEHHAAAAGFSSWEWLLPEETGFYQPIFRALKPTPAA